MKRCQDRDGLARVLLVGLAGLCLSCHSDSPSPEVEYSGCWAVNLPGPVCTLWPEPYRRLNLWVKTDPGTAVEIKAGGQRLEATGDAIDGGRRYRRLHIPEHASSITVSVSLADSRHSAIWSLMLAEPEIPRWISEIEGLEVSGKKEQARRRLLELRKDAPRKEQGLVVRSLAGLARADGDSGEAEAYLKQGIAADRAEGCLSCEIEKTAWLAWLYLDQGRFSDARRILETQPLPESPAESKYLMAYQQGWLADRVGDYRSALGQLRKAADLAERVGRTDYRWKAEQNLARLLQDLGRSQEASTLFAQLHAQLGEDLRNDPHLETPCDVGSLLTNWAWSRLLAWEGGEETEDPTPMLKKAQAIFDNEGCSRPDQRLNIRLNLALAHQQAGRWRDARQALEQARPLASEANLSQRLWWHDLEGRAAIAEGQPARALRLYEELEGMAKRALSLEGRFRASLGRARAELALGRRPSAREALAEADRLIDEQSRHVPAYEGRDTLIAQREEATRLYLSLLLEEDERQSAFALVRRVRSRLLRQLMVRDRLSQLTPGEQQQWDRALAGYQALRDAVDREAAQEWELSGDLKTAARESRASRLAQARDDLDRAVAGLGSPGDRNERSFPPPRPGEVILAYHPLPKGLWAGFAADERGIEVRTFKLPAQGTGDSVALAQVVLEPFRPALERAERVRILPYGRLRLVDFHTLPFGGELLLARHLVAYGLDLPVRPSPAPLGRGVALLVADPQGDLPAARQEAIAVEAAVRTWAPGWTLERLEDTAAQAKAVRAKLPAVRLFHYAGHGSFAGFAGWDSMLLLADGSRLTLGDLLTLPQAPAWVVLSACDAGRSSEQAPGEGIGLAQAFLLAGSQAVVAATRRVPDRTARDLVRELYRGWQAGADLPRQFQRAQKTCIYSYSTADCASFRLLEP